MYHGMKIGEKDTWDDWHLVPTERPIVPVPDVKAISADIPGGDGIYDMTETLDGCVHYETRSASFDFYVMNGFQPFYVLYKEILNYLHGRRKKLILEDDPNYYYTGRFTVSASNNDTWAKINISATMDPFKYEHELTTLTFTGISNNGQLTMPIVEIPTRITITSSVACTISYAGRTSRSLSAGVSDNKTVLIPHEQKYIVVTGISSGTTNITIQFRKGAL